MVQVTVWKQRRDCTNDSSGMAGNGLPAAALTNTVHRPKAAAAVAAAGQNGLEAVGKQRGFPHRSVSSVVHWHGSSTNRTHAARSSSTATAAAALDTPATATPAAVQAAGKVLARSRQRQQAPQAVEPCRRQQQWPQGNNVSNRNSCCPPHPHPHPPGRLTPLPSTTAY
jgi:hypothetical protein